MGEEHSSATDPWGAKLRKLANVGKNDKNSPGQAPDLMSCLWP